MLLIVLWRLGCSGRFGQNEFEAPVPQHTGFQYTPVASIATCVQLLVSSQPNSTRLAVVVVNVRTESDTSPPSAMRTHATTVSL